MTKASCDLLVQKSPLGILDPHYTRLGLPQIFGAPNSNNALTSMINRSGGVFAPQLYPGGGNALASGIGIPTGSGRPSGLIKILGAVWQLTTAFSSNK
jgi:hypothetical protein